MQQKLTKLLQRWRLNAATWAKRIQTLNTKTAKNQVEPLITAIVIVTIVFVVGAGGIVALPSRSVGLEFVFVAVVVIAVCVGIAVVTVVVVVVAVVVVVVAAVVVV